jgi:hypothetical protein
MFRSLLAAAAVAVFAAPAAAQEARPFPPTALRGELVVQQPPIVSVNGEEARLAPGARIRGRDNLLVMSASVVGVPLLVHYTIDDSGLVKDVWVLRDDEAAKSWPTTREQAARWAYDPATQTWTRR